MTLRLQAPYQARPAGLLLMNNKWTFPTHSLRTSCHYKPFCFFSVVVMYHIAWLDVISEKVTKGMCTFLLHSLPTRSHPITTAPLKEAMANVDTLHNTSVWTYGTKLRRSPAHRPHLSAINTPHFVREAPQKKVHRSLAWIEDKSQESQGQHGAFRI